ATGRRARTRSASARSWALEDTRGPRQTAVRTVSAAISATSVGVRPTRTPFASSASALAAAVPFEPDTIAPAWPIVLPGGAVKPAIYARTGFDTFASM